MSEKIKQLLFNVKEKWKNIKVKAGESEGEKEETKIKKFQWSKKKTATCLIGGVVVLIAGGIVAAGFFFKAGNNEENLFGMFGKGGKQSGFEYVSASGTTTLGYTMDEFEPDYIETELYIEEVYISSGDEVEKGTPVLKVSNESVQEARAELEEKVVTTSLAYRAGVISYEQSKINAKYTYDSAVLEGQQAEAVYNSAIKEAENKLKKAQDAVTEAEEQIEEYTNAAENSGYYDDYKIDDYKKRYETNYNLYYQLLSDWGIDESELNVSAEANVSNFVLLSALVDESVQEESTSEEALEEKESEENTTGESTSEEDSSEEDSSEEDSSEEDSSEEDSSEEGSSEEDSSEADSSEEESSVEGPSKDDSPEKESTEDKSEKESSNQQNSNENDKERTEKIKILQQLKKAMQSSETAYAKAWEEYGDATDKAVTQLKKLNAQIESLRADLTEAQTTYELEKLEAETTYKKALAQTNLAQSDYDAAIQKATDELEALEDDKTEAEENLAEFEALLGDGYFYTQNAGTVMMVGCESETNLQGNSMVVAYRNAEDISVSVSVAQEDINKLSVGDSAQVILDDYGTYEGVVSYLNPISTSDSRTNITYEVIVSLTGEDVSSLKENLTAEVIFQTGEQEE